jgi:hypothetical protein
VLFTLAYNCGPDRVRELRREAAAKGLNPNIWINNVEVIAAARIGAETVNYVSNIYKYYVAYKLIAVQARAAPKSQRVLPGKAVMRKCRLRLCRSRSESDGEESSFTKSLCAHNVFPCESTGTTGAEGSIFIPEAQPPEII